MAWTERARDGSALVIVDVQAGFDDPWWGRRNNPECEHNIERLLSHWRRAGHPVVFVRHDSQGPDSPLRPGEPGNDLQPILSGSPDLLVTKTVNSSFHGSPDLRAWLTAGSIGSITVCGITTNHCCETTARVGANLGFDGTFVLDATYTFDRTAPDGRVVDADTLAHVTATNLHGEFARVVSTDDLLAAVVVPQRSPAAGTEDGADTCEDEPGLHRGSRRPADHHGHGPGDDAGAPGEPE